MCFYISYLQGHKIHYRKPALCRVPEALPSVFYRALGKDGPCRVSFFGTRQRCILPSAIFWHMAKCVFAECLFLALGKDVFCRVLFFGTRQNASLPSAFFWNSAKMYFAECFVLVLGKEAFCCVHFFLPSANHFFKAIFEALNEFK